MQETIATLQKAIKSYQAREEGYKDTIMTLSGNLEAKTASVTRLLMRTDRMARDMKAMERDIKHLQQAMLDMSKTQVKNTESRKKFEAGYWQRVGE